MAHVNPAFTMPNGHVDGSISDPKDNGESENRADDAGTTAVTASNFINGNKEVNRNDAAGMADGASHRKASGLGFGHKGDKVAAEESQFRLSEYLRQDVTIDAEDLDNAELMKMLIQKFEKKSEMWKCKTKTLKCFNLFITLMVMLIQVVEVVLFQISSATISTATRDAIATIFPTVTGTVLGIQLKLAWNSKARKAKECVNFYERVLNRIKSFQDITKAGGKVPKRELVKFWNIEGHAELDQVPPSFHCF